MYILSFDYTGHADGWISYVTELPIQAAEILLDENFLKDYEHKFDQGITGYRINQVNEERDTWEMVVQYWSWLGEYQETTIYMFKINHITSFGVNKYE